MDGSQESGLGFRSETPVRHPSKAVKEKLNMGLSSGERYELEIMLGVTGIHG